MGRNADKRKARKQPPPTTASTAAAASPSAPADPEEDLRAINVPRSLAGALQMPQLAEGGSDGTLARALFRLTCLLAVRDRYGVPAANMQRLAEEVAGIVEADTVSLLKLELGDDVVPSRLVLLGSHGLAPADEGLVTFEVGDGVAGQVAMSGQPLRIEDAPRDTRFHRLYGQRTEIGSLLAVPLRFQHRVLGVLTASRREIRAFQPDDEERLRLVADSIAQDLEQTRLLFDAVTDPLTGLGSRLALLVELPRALEIARRYRTELSLLVLDVDGLRNINDTHGKHAGDRFLVEVGRRLRASLRAADLAVRLGGDEMAVLLPMTPANAARGLAKRLVRLLAQPMAGLDGIAPTWSVGVATLAPGDEDALGLLWRCDEALSNAKAEGGDTIVSSVLRRASAND